MTKDVTILSPRYSKSREYCEHGAMALLLALALVQITLSFGASSSMLADRPDVAKVRYHQHLTLIAKK